MLLDGRAQESGLKRRGRDETLFVAMNGYQGVVPFTLPSAPGGRRWTRLVDTNRGGTALEHFEFGQRYELAGRTLVLFVLH
jgi:glycogen operon protein